MTTVADQRISRQRYLLRREISRLTADNEALRKERDEAIAAHHRTSHKAVKRLRALWREKQAAEARADALAQEVERLKSLLREVLDGRECGWILTDTDLVPEDVTSAFFEKVSRAALGDRP